MPFDGTPPLDIPSLEALSYVLRHRELWPSGFVWDYSDLDTCAIGLAEVLWACDPYNDPDWCGIEDDDFNRIFVDLGVSRWLPECVRDLLRQRVTPEHVADAIDAYLASKSGAHPAPDRALVA